MDNSWAVATDLAQGQDSRSRCRSPAGPPLHELVDHSHELVDHSDSRWVAGPGVGRLIAVTLTRGAAVSFASSAHGHRCPVVSCLPSIVPISGTTSGRHRGPDHSRRRSSQVDPATGRPEAVVSGGHMLRWPFRYRDGGTTSNYRICR